MKDLPSKKACLVCDSIQPRLLAHINILIGLGYDSYTLWNNKYWKVDGNLNDPNSPKPSPAAEEIGIQTIVSKANFVLLHKGDMWRVENHLSIPVVTYSGDGRNSDVPRAVDKDHPLTPVEIGRISNVMTLPESERRTALRAIWSGIPEIILAWTIVQHAAPGESGIGFIEQQVRDGFNDLRSALEASKGDAGLPPKCEKGLPVLDDAKKLIVMAKESV